MPVTRIKNKEAFYAVAKGRKIGIFSTWDEAQPLVKGFAGAKYKKFNSLDQARTFLGKGYENENVTSLNLDDSSEIEEIPVASSSSSSSYSSSATRSSRRIATNCAPSTSSDMTSDLGKNENSKTNSIESLSLAILPQSLRGESLQFFQDNSLLLCMTSSNLYQVHSFQPNNVHSWFTSDQILSGQCHYFTRVDPILVCLRHLFNHTVKEGKTLTQVFVNMPLLNCKLIQSLNLQIICDTVPSKFEDDFPQANIKYQLNLDRVLSYLQGKINAVVSLVTSGKVKCLRVNDTGTSLALEQLQLFLPISLYEHLVKRVSP